MHACVHVSICFLELIHLAILACPLGQVPHLVASGSVGGVLEVVNFMYVCMYVCMHFFREVLLLLVHEGSFDPSGCRRQR